MDEFEFNPMFRGVFVPAPVWEAYQNGELNGTDLKLLLLIEALYNSKTGVGCWATDKYLSDKLILSRESIKRTIRRLKDGGWIVARYGSGPGRQQRRYLETCWSDAGRRNSIKGSKMTPIKGSKMTPGIVLLRNTPTNKKNFSDDDGDGMIGFNGEEVGSAAGRNQRKKTTAFDRLCASSLLRAATPTKPPTRRQVQQEAHHFRRLREIDQVKEETLQRVLDYHCAHIRDKYQPRAFTCVKFRSKYQQIEDAYLRAHPPEEELHIDDLAKEYVNSLMTMHWPKGVTRKRLEVEVQIGLNWLKEFWPIVERVKTEEAEAHAEVLEYNESLYQKYERQGYKGKALRRRVHPKCRSHKHGRIADACEELERLVYTEWVLDHYLDVQRQVSRWESWSGNLEMFRFSWDAKHVQAHLKELIEGWDSNAVELTIERLMDESEQAG